MMPYCVENRLQPPRLADVRLEGYAGELAERFFEGRIFSEEAQATAFAEAEEAFRHPSDDETAVGYWKGEFWGKWIISAARVCRYSGNERLRAFLRRAAHTMLSFQREDGYIGTYKDEDFVCSPDPAETEKVVGWRCNWCWNVWCRKYTLWGLLELYELLGEEEILTGCRRLADHLIGQLDRLGLTLTETGTFHGLPSGSILKPMLILYRLTGEERYLRLCVQTAEDWDRPDNRMPNLIANALSGRPVRDWYDDEHWAKAYEMMSCADGLLELYRVTGTEKYFRACAALFDNLIKNERNVLFSVGFNDQFSHAAREINAVTEPCDVIHWMRLCYELFALTGEAKYMDAFELASLNPFLAGVYEDGKWGSRGVRSSGMHMAARQCGLLYSHCCVNNMPRGFMNMAEAAVMREKGALLVNQYGDASVILRGKEGQDEVRIRGGYPRACRARITIDHQGPEGALLMRIPAWSETARVVWNGDVHETRGGGFLRLPLPAWSVNCAEVYFDDAPRIVPFPHPVAKHGPEDWKAVRWSSRSSEPLAESTALTPQDMVDSPRCTLRVGPVLLARSKKNGNTEQEMFGAGTLFGGNWECRLTPLPGGGLCRYTAHFTGPEGRFDTVVCDYASCANRIVHDARYMSVWF